MKNLLQKIGLALIGLAFISCDYDTPAYNQNFQVEWEGEHPEYIWIKIANGDWEKKLNDGSFVELDFDIHEPEETKYKTYTLDFTSKSKVDAVFFNGFYNIVYDKDGNSITSTNMEMQFDKWKGNGFISSGRLNEHQRYNLFVTRYD